MITCILCAYAHSPTSGDRSGCCPIMGRCGLSTGCAQGVDKVVDLWIRVWIKCGYFLWITCGNEFGGRVLGARYDPTLADPRRLEWP